MQALEKIVTSNNWITILLVLLLSAIFLLKALNSEKLKNYVYAFFNKDFVEEETEENTTLFKSFYLLFFVFSVSILSLIVYFFITDKAANIDVGFFSFSIVFLFVLVYFIVKWILEQMLSSLFLLKKEIHFFLISKVSYLYSITIFLFVAIILMQYSVLNTTFLYFLTGVLFFIRFLLHVLNNKKLIFNKLFYFILYLCAFEIAPLFILFKLIF